MFPTQSSTVGANETKYPLAMFRTGMLFSAETSDECSNTQDNGYDKKDDPDLLKFCKALPECIPLTFGFRANSRNSFCPLCPHMGGWRTHNGLSGMKSGNLCVNEGTHLSCKDLYSHVTNIGKKCKFHNVVQQYLFHCYKNYYGNGKNHHGIISKSRNEYTIAEEKDKEMFMRMNESRLRRAKYKDVKYEATNPISSNKVHTSNNTSDASMAPKSPTDNSWNNTGRFWGDTDNSSKKQPWGGVVNNDIKKTSASTLPKDDVIEVDSSNDLSSDNCSSSTSYARKPNVSSSDDDSSSDDNSVPVKNRRLLKGSNGNRKIVTRKAKTVTKGSKNQYKKTSVEVTMKRGRDEDVISDDVKANILVEYPGIKFTDEFGTAYPKETLKKYMKKNANKRQLGRRREINIILKEIMAPHRIPLIIQAALMIHLIKQI